MCMPLPPVVLGYPSRPMSRSFVMHQLRRFDNPVIAAVVGIKIDQDEVRMIQRPKAAHVWVLVNAAQVGQVQQ